MFNVTKATSVAVHPFTGSVTVKVYVPAALTVGVAVVAPETMFPPLLATQAKVASAVVEEPLKAIEVTVQVNTLSAPAFTLGGVIFFSTNTVAWAKQPVKPGAKALTVYVPGSVTTLSGSCVLSPGISTLEGLYHSMVDPVGVIFVAVIVASVLVQVITRLTLALTVGATVSPNGNGPAKSFCSLVKESDCPPAELRVLTNKLPNTLAHGSEPCPFLSNPKAVRLIPIST